MSKSLRDIWDEVQKLAHQIATLNSRLFTDDKPAESQQNPRQYSINAVQADGESDSEPQDREAVTVRFNLPKSINVQAETQERTKPKLKDRHFVVQVIAVVFAGVVAIIYGLQLRTMNKAMEVDQRAWIGFKVPQAFPLDGLTIPVASQLTNSGKTPAMNVTGEAIATVLNKGEKRNFDFSIGHPHNKIYAGAIFPNDPIVVQLTVGKYGDFQMTPVVPDDKLRADIKSGARYIAFYGRITYWDIFGKERHTQFCTGTGSEADLDTVKECIAYNKAD